ncbi:MULTISPECIES: AbiTii domain-containing protein [Enterobacteriaceae]|uniref:AbiTii domain-containing protein n=1 Tax=Enterobacteriaceae TaxID=543 RepID=UPI000CFB316D|nr:MULTISPECIES: abortive phage resistance protein [Enterobacteriaceae]HEI2755492.1 abortive phage resistance protein [Escherichia coli]ELY4324220.1 abortive phage resistance protein [Cronobacter sakazakii]ELY4472294.1 abortive phage resistance protein [Cronobacter sakazakii]ELY4761774.1 abortive phage resistance protein [Cronobacter sakazakii]ELY6118707.1 abortive phage resistance protein [Cronobacter sakazakii]
MNNSPVLKLQEMAGSKTADVEEILSKAKMISVKLGLDDISEWLEHELTGYPSLDTLPPYRVITEAPVMALNPYSGWVPFQIVNTTGANKEVYESLTTIHINNPVAMLVEHAKSESELHADLPTFMTNLLHQMSGCQYRMAWRIYPAQIINILSAVRYRILDWTLLLEKKGILGEGLLFSQEEKKEAAGMTVNNINNFNGNVNNSGAIGAGNTGDINQQNSITAGDFNTLERQLKEYGIEDSDIKTLKQAIEQSPAPTSSNNLGGEIGNWVGAMIGKAYSGSLKIAGAVAPALLTNAICAYLNIPV